jgi:aspartyl-tRNA(Asn)/glutamyl-tRNA(Gln) amidotransferase subunit C
VTAAKTPSVSEEQVRHVAKLAHLVFTPAETESLRRDLSSILGYVAKLDELDTSTVEPTLHAAVLPTAWRLDGVRPGLSVEEAVRNAPERLGDAFGVPKIIE